jgi:hypothetical protein
MKTGPSNHEVLSECLISWLDHTALDQKENWFFHAARELVDRLLANPNCNDNHAERLAEHRQQINRLQRHDIA